MTESNQQLSKFVRKMSSHGSNMNLIYCHFPSSVPTTKLYACYKNEKCCDTGCCLGSYYEVYRIWYYWVLLLVMFGVFYSSSWYCKQSHVASTETDANEHDNSLCEYYIPQANLDNSMLSDRLFVPFRNRINSRDPPSYNTLLAQDRRSEQSNNYNNYGPPPKYSACNLTNQNAQTSVEVHSVTTTEPIVL